MDHLPNDPAMLVSAVNMLLRDGEFDNLEELCSSFNRDCDELKAMLAECGFDYDAKALRFY